MDEIAFSYDETKNPEGSLVDGVPLRDLTADEFKALRPNLQAAVKAQPYYVAVKKAASKKAEPAEAKEK
jgi:hypothetical protein